MKSNWGKSKILKSKMGGGIKVRADNGTGGKGTGNVKWDMTHVWRTFKIKYQTKFKAITQGKKTNKLKLWDIEGIVLTPGQYVVSASSCWLLIRFKSAEVLSSTQPLLILCSEGQLDLSSSSHKMRPSPMAIRAITTPKSPIESERWDEWDDTMSFNYLIHFFF